MSTRVGNWTESDTFGVFTAKPEGEPAIVEVVTTVGSQRVCVDNGEWWKLPPDEAERLGVYLIQAAALARTVVR